MEYAKQSAMERALQDHIADLSAQVYAFMDYVRVYVLMGCIQSSAASASAASRQRDDIDKLLDSDDDDLATLEVCAQ